MITSHFGGCPECPTDRGPDNLYHAGKANIGACHRHRTKWWVGSGLVSTPETIEEQEARYVRDGLPDYKRIENFAWDRAAA